MNKQTKIDDDEINLVELLVVAWKGKIKILAIVLISTLSFIIYLNYQSKNFIATTNIKPISAIEENRFTDFNTFNSKFNLKEKLTII